MSNNTSLRALRLASEASAAWQAACEDDTQSCRDIEQVEPELVKLLDQLHGALSRAFPRSYIAALYDVGQVEEAQFIEKNPH